MIEYKQPYVEPETTQINLSENSIGYGEVVTAEKYNNWQNCHVNFGPDCENVINALIEFGIIESVDDIWWGEEHVEEGKELHTMIETETVIQN